MEEGGRAPENRLEEIRQDKTRQDICMCTFVIKYADAERWMPFSQPASQPASQPSSQPAIPWYIQEDFNIACRPCFFK